MAYHRYEPPAALRPWVVCAWTVARQFDPLYLSQPVLPDSYVELVFNLGEPYDIELAPNCRLPAPPCYLVGLLRQPLHLLAAPGARVLTLAVRCHPWAAGLLRVPVVRLGQPLTDLTAVYRDWWPALHRSVQAGQVAEAAAELLGRLAARLLGRQPELAGLLDLRALPAGQPLGQTLAAGSAPRRRLERCCRRYAGTSPQGLRRLLRFEQASHYLHAHPRASLAAVAYEFGYADQAHLTREFRQLAGCSPGAWADGVAKRQDPAAGGR